MPSLEEIQKFKQLQQVYKKWEDLQTKGELKMKMKIDKQKKQYYDFDYSRYQYYYNYPKDHFAFLAPEKQKQTFELLMKKILHADTRMFKDKQQPKNKYNNGQTDQESDQEQNCHNQTQSSRKFFNFDQPYQNQLYFQMKPYQLQHFLHDYRQRLKTKIITLRIKKSLMIPKNVKQLFKDNQQKKSLDPVIQLVETQIRTYISKLNRITQFNFQFDDNLAQRLQGKKSHLKSIQRDELHFSLLQKSDIIVYQRLLKTDFRLSKSLKCFQYDIGLILNFRFHEIQRKSYLQSLQQIKQIQSNKKKIYQHKKQIIMEYLTEKQPSFLQEYTNLSSIENFLKRFDYIEKQSSIGSKGCLNINLHYQDVQYIPENMEEQKNLVIKICSSHFSQELIRNLISPEIKQNYSEEHVCFKLTKLGSTLFKICQETYDLTIKFQDRQVLSKRVLMQRQLQTIFAKDVSKLLNMQEHQSFTLVESDYSTSYIIKNLEQKSKLEISEKQQIFQKYLQSYDYKDPFLCTFFNLLFSRKQKNFHSSIGQYTNFLNRKDVFSKKLQYLLLFYDNIHSDPKNHLINVINKKLSLRKEIETGQNLNKFLGILYLDSKKKQQKVSIQLLNSVYFMRMISAVIKKNKLLNILNGQINIMLKLKNRLNFLKRKSNLKFELSKQFITRYTETNEKKQDPFDFLRQIQTVDQKVSYEIPKDKLYIQKQKMNVYVKRTNPDNPFFQGRNIIYQESISQTQKSIERLIKLGSKIIQKRENYLAGQDLTCIVDRIQLLYALIQKQANYQMMKLLLLSQYYEILKKTTNPQGIKLASQNIYKIKTQQFCMSLHLNNFVQQYQHLTQNLRLRTELIQKLKTIQIKKQKEQVIQISNGLVRKNFNQHSPQISSIYYAQNNGEQIQQESDEQNQFNDSKINNQIQGKSDIIGSSILDISQISGTHLSNKNSEYHVKKSFKQILGFNQTSSIKKSVQKKEKMLNRKKKRVFNDSIMGKLLSFQYQGNQEVQILQFSEYVYQVMSILDCISQNFQNNQSYKQTNFRNFALIQIISEISNFSSKSIQQQDLLQQQLLSSSLHECSKCLSKLVEKIKINPSSIEHYACFSKILIQNLIQNTSSNQVNQYRGLYLCLNHIQMNKILYENSITKYRQQRLKQYLEKTLTKYSSYKIGKESILLISNVLQNHINPQFKLVSSIDKKRQNFLTLLGQYNIYNKLRCLLDSAFLEFYEKCLLNLNSDYINKFENLCTELELICKANCWIGDGSINKLNEFTRIQNKVWISKKYQTLIQSKKNLLSKQFLTQFLIIPLKLSNQAITKKYVSKACNDGAALLQSAKQFQSYLYLINNLCSKLMVLNWNLHQKFISNINIKTTQSYLKILPYLSSKIEINNQQSKLFKEVFFQQILIAKQKGFIDPSSQLPTFIVSALKFKPSFVTNIILPLNKPLLSQSFEQLFRSLTKRLFNQFKSGKQMENKKREIKQYFYKNFNILYSFTDGKTCFKALIHLTSLKNQAQFRRISKLKNFIEANLLLFGNQLSSDEQIKLRTILLNKTQNFNIFWKDQTSNLIQTSQFVKLKNFRLQSNVLIQRYRKQYLTFNNLRHKYKLLIQKLIETDLAHELEDSIYLIIICIYSLGLQNKIKPISFQDQYFRFLNNFGQQFKKPDLLTSLFQNILKEKVSLNFILNNFKFQAFKKIMWVEKLQNEKFNQFKQFQERNRYLRFHINSIKRQHDADLKNQLLHFKFQKLVLSNVLRNSGIEIQSHKMKLQIFSKSFRQKVYEKSISLNQTQIFVLDISPKNQDKKSKLQSLKDQSFENVYFIKYYEKIFIQKMYEYSIAVLNQELQLKKILGDSFEQRLLNKDNKIINQSLNKVLAPKVMLNPFLNSPLLLSNYFFAGALKLSYVDSFLNKMKNRAIMIELAEGGFGFLLKINELDESINSLCKGIISYSEKQFTDRLRTYFQYTDQLKEALSKLKRQNDNLKVMNKLHAFYDQKQVKSLVYEKLSKYLLSVTQKTQTYETLFQLFQNLEAKIMKQCNFKYQSRINQLEKQNFILKKSFKDFQQKLKNSSISNINESKDVLYNDLKDKAQKVLNKQFMQKYQQIQSSPFKQKEAYDTEILLQKLKEQHIVMKLKLSAMKSQYQKKIQQLNIKLSEKQKLFDILKEEKQKNQFLHHEVNFLSNKAIQVESLQKQRQLDLQERMVEKFKLIRVNQALQGRLERFQPNMKSKQKEQKLQKLKDFANEQINQRDFQKTNESVFITKQQKKRSITQFGIQTCVKKFPDRSLSRIKKRSVALKTEPNSLSYAQYNSTKLQNIEQSRIWRQRWQKNQLKYQNLANKIRVITENHKLTKNVKKTIQKLLLLGDQINYVITNPTAYIKKPQLNQIL